MTIIKRRTEEQLQHCETLRNDLGTTFPWHVSPDDPMLAERKPNETLDRMLNSLTLDTEELGSAMGELFALAKRESGENDGVASTRSAAAGAAGADEVEFDAWGLALVREESGADKEARLRKALDAKTGKEVDDDMRLLDRALKEDPFRLRMLCGLYYLRDVMLTKLDDFLRRIVDARDVQLQRDIKWEIPKTKHFSRTGVKKKVGRLRISTTPAMESHLTLAETVLRLDELLAMRLLPKRQFDVSRLEAAHKQQLDMWERSARENDARHAAELSSRDERIEKLTKELRLYKSDKMRSKMSADHLALIKMETVNKEMQTMEKDMMQLRGRTGVLLQQLEDEKRARASERADFHQAKQAHAKQVANLESSIRKLDKHARETRRQLEDAVGLFHLRADGADSAVVLRQAERLVASKGLHARTAGDGADVAEAGVLSDDSEEGMDEVQRAKHRVAKAKRARDAEREKRREDMSRELSGDTFHQQKVELQEVKDKLAEVIDELGERDVEISALHKDLDRYRHMLERERAQQRSVYDLVRTTTGKLKEAEAKQHAAEEALRKSKRSPAEAREEDMRDGRLAAGLASSKLFASDRAAQATGERVDSLQRANKYLRLRVEQLKDEVAFLKAKKGQ